MREKDVRYWLTFTPQNGEMTDNGGKHCISGNGDSVKHLFKDANLSRKFVLFQSMHVVRLVENWLYMHCSVHVMQQDLTYG